MGDPLNLLLMLLTVLGGTCCTELRDQALRRSTRRSAQVSAFWVAVVWGGVASLDVNFAGPRVAPRGPCARDPATSAPPKALALRKGVPIRGTFSIYQLRSRASSTSAPWRRGVVSCFRCRGSSECPWAGSPDIGAPRSFHLKGHRCPIFLIGQRPCSQVVGHPQDAKVARELLPHDYSQGRSNRGTVTPFPGRSLTVPSDRIWILSYRTVFTGTVKYLKFSI
jgi:hypothetical protein